MVVCRDFVVWLGGLTLVAMMTCPSISQEPIAAWKRQEGTPPAWLTADAARWARSNETRKAMAKKVTYNFQGIPLNKAMQEISAKWACRSTSTRSNSIIAVAVQTSRLRLRQRAPFE